MLERALPILLVLGIVLNFAPRAEAFGPAEWTHFTRGDQTRAQMQSLRRETVELRGRTGSSNAQIPQASFA